MDGGGGGDVEAVRSVSRCPGESRLRSRCRGRGGEDSSAQAHCLQLTGACRLV